MKETSQTIDAVFETFTVIGSTRLCLLLEELQNDLHKMYNRQDKRPEGQTAEVIAEDHFVAAEDREVSLLVRAVGVVPEAAGTSDNKDSHGLNESVAP